MDKKIIWKGTNTIIIKIIIAIILAYIGISIYFKNYRNPKISDYIVLLITILIILYWLFFTTHYSQLKICKDGLLIAQSKKITVKRKFLRWDEISDIDISLEKSMDEQFFRDLRVKYLRINDVFGKKYRNLVLDEDEIKKVLCSVYKQGNLSKLTDKPGWMK